MSIAQALAIAAAAWITTVAVDPAMTARFRHAQWRADALVSRLETTATRLTRIESGFRATPDGGCIERRATLR